jgi:hypothetical protein
MNLAVGGGGGNRNAYRILVGRPGRKRPPRRLRLILEDNIKMDLREIRSGSMNWVFIWFRRHQCGAIV